MKSLTEYICNISIFEMAYKFGDFNNKLINLSEQIVQNWCLVKQCDLNPDNDISKRLRNHWASELKSYILQIVNIKLKSGRKDKAVRNILINTLELDNQSQVINYISYKFNKEHLSLYTNIIVQEFTEHIYGICDILPVTNNTELVDNYLKPEIGQYYIII